jgi:hypothetical protein|tara:strand:+ start:781 stop:1242 length:462 start_codon:yes stop_codon:yes gene_type:complete
MLLADIVKELERQVGDLSDFGYKIKGNVRYRLKGTIIFESKDGLKTRYVREDSGGTEIEEERINIDKICFEGILTYLTDSDVGKLRFSPITNLQTRTNFIVAIAEEMAKEEDYEFSYDEKENKILISSRKNLEEELRRTEKIFGNPMRIEFEI